MTRPKVRLVRSPAEWAVVSAPRRIEIVEAMRCLGVCSLAEVAELLDRPADSLYRHVEQLQEAGFVRAAGYRKSSGHIEQLFELVADDFQIDFANQSAEERTAVAETVRRFSGSVAKAAATSAESGALILGAKRNLLIDYELTWLTPARFAKARRLIEQWKALLDEGRRAGEGQLFVTFATVLPVTRRRRARRRAAAAPPDAAARTPRKGGRRRSPSPSP